MVFGILFLGLWLSTQAESSCDIPKPYTGNLPPNLVKDGDGIPNFEEDGDDTYLACPNMQWAMKKEGTGSILSSSDYIFCIENEWRTEGGVFIEEDDEFVCTIGKLDPQRSCKISLSGSFQDILKDTVMECQPGQTTVIKINGNEVAGQKLTCVKDGTVTIDGTTYNYQNTPNEIARIDCNGEPIRSTTSISTTSVIPACCPKDGIWSEWTPTEACPTECGACTNVTRTRTCESEVDGCPCTGLATEIGPCGMRLCTFPVKTCCDPYAKRLNKRTKEFFCGFEDVPLDENYNCSTSTVPITTTTTTTTSLPTTTTTSMQPCIAGGVWSEWVTTEDCPVHCNEKGENCQVCGSCFNATRVRTCISEKTCGCTCDGPVTDVGPCGVELCRFPMKTCCAPYEKSLDYNTKKFFCGPRSLPKGQDLCGTDPLDFLPPSCCPNNGIWSEWTTIGTCPTSCGSYNNLTRTRTCESEVNGCPCIGLSTGIGPCGIALCNFPNKACSSPYTKQLNNNTGELFCGLFSVPKNLVYCRSSTETASPSTTTSAATTTTSTVPITTTIVTTTTTLPKTTRTTTTLPKTTTTSMKPCVGGGVWSEWVTTEDCPMHCDEKGANCQVCGSCFNATRVRTCISETTCGCTCAGVATDVGPCGVDLCFFPMKTCCPPYVKSLDNSTRKFFCGASSVPKTQDQCGTEAYDFLPACCPKEGVWSEWTTIGSCPTKCGSSNNQTRKRTCESAADGCPCTGRAADTGPCGIDLCTFPNKTCSSPYVKSLNNNTRAFFCGLFSVPLNPKYNCN